MERERDRAREDLKTERTERAKDNVIPAKEVPEYAKWKSEQRTKNAQDRVLDRSFSYGR